MRRRAETNTSSGSNQGGTLISIRTSQQRRRMEGAAGNRGRADLPRSFSTPGRNVEFGTATSEKDKSCIMRSYSTPEPKRERKRECDNFFRPQICVSKNDLDPDLEQLEDPILDVDADNEQSMFGSYRHNPKRDELKKVTASLLPGSGLHRVSVRPISTKRVLMQTQDNKKEKHGKQELLKAQDRLKSRPPMLKIPPVQSFCISINEELPSSSVEELQISPLIDVEGAILEQELKAAEQHMEKEVAIATEESDGDTPDDTRGCRRLVTCPMGDSLRDRLDIGVTGYRYGSGQFVHFTYPARKRPGGVVVWDVWDDSVMGVVMVTTVRIPRNSGMFRWQVHLSLGRRPALTTPVESTASRGAIGHTVPVVAERVIDKRPGPAAGRRRTAPCTVGVVQHFRADNGTGAGLEYSGCPLPNNERALTLGAHGRRGAGRDGAMTPARAARGPAFGCDPPRTPSA
ncbi:hypothetical protein EVAR_39077_1 [Eumeta japonica]|uniref:Uncharacterized protein n=1 Tax=Eumeta variegata TaxID=151549 RepID=A0A4C1WR12_EUMVA|nr:hypothetical protein EVAR_39077_1 [Eumeta japonica]